MGTTSIPSLLTLAVALVWTATAPMLVAQEEPGIQPGFGPVISGRVGDPQQLRPEEAALMLGWHEGHGSFSRRPIPIAADGSPRDSFLLPSFPATTVFAASRSPVSSRLALRIWTS